MNTPALAVDPHVKPWWRYGMVWMVVAGPALVVVASFATLAIVLTHPDPVLPTGAPDNAAADVPAMQARNHAADPH
jgi:hypothetical protein